MLTHCLVIAGEICNVGDGDTSLQPTTRQETQRFRRPLHTRRGAPPYAPNGTHSKVVGGLSRRPSDEAVSLRDGNKSLGFEHFAGLDVLRPFELDTGT